MDQSINAGLLLSSQPRTIISRTAAAPAAVVGQVNVGPWIALDMVCFACAFGVVELAAHNGNLSRCLRCANDSGMVSGNFRLRSH